VGSEQMTETDNGHYCKMNNLDDAMDAMIKQMLDQDGSVKGFTAEAEYKGRKFSIEVKEI
jgi:hypothetical protein